MADDCGSRRGTADDDVGPSDDADPSDDGPCDGGPRGGVGALGRPRPLSLSCPAAVEHEKPLEASERTGAASERTWEASTMTCDDWGAERGAVALRCRPGDDRDVRIEDVHRLRARVAELESRERRGRWHERENTELIEKIRDMQEEDLERRLEAFGIQQFLQEKIETLQKQLEDSRREVKLLQADNLELLKKQKRRASASGRKGVVGKENQKDMERLPPRQFPAVITFKRSSTTGEMEAPRLQGDRDTAPLEADRLSRSERPRTITFTRRTVGETEGSDLRESFLSDITFRGKAPSEDDAQGVDRNDHQKASKRAVGCVSFLEQPGDMLSDSDSDSEGSSAAEEVKCEQVTKNDAKHALPQKLSSRPALRKANSERVRAADTSMGVPSPRGPRRRTMEARPSLLSLCRGLITPLVADAPSPMHDSWATAEEINHQTEMFNRMASARRKAKAKLQDRLAESERVQSKARHQAANDGIGKKPALRRTSTTGEIEALRLEQMEANCLSRLQQPHTITLEAPHLRESYLSDVTFHGKVSAEKGAEGSDHIGNQKTAKKEAGCVSFPEKPRDLLSDSDSKGKSAAGEVNLKLVARNDAERALPRKWPSRPAFRKANSEKARLADTSMGVPPPRGPRRRTLEARPSLLSLYRGLLTPIVDGAPSPMNDSLATGGQPSERNVQSHGQHATEVQGQGRQAPQE